MTWISLVVGMFAFAGAALFPHACNLFQQPRMDLHQPWSVEILLLLVVLAGLLIMTQIFGRVGLARNGDEGSVFIGLGSIGWTRKFSWRTIESLKEIGTPSPLGRGFVSRLIELDLCSDSPARLRFGALLTDERRWFLLAVLRSQLAKQP
jgi:hypothetical protein